MPPKPTNASNAAISAAVKAAAAVGKMAGGGGSANSTAKQPPKKKKTIVKAKRPGGNNSPVVLIGKDDTVHPPPSKLGVMKSRPFVGKKDSATAAAENIQFSSQYASQKKKTGGTATVGGSAGGNAGGAAGGGNSKSTTSPNPATASQSQLQQLKIEKAQIAKRELAEMDSIERAFQEDANVWVGPTSVVFPRRYHTEKDSMTEDDEGGRAKKKRKSDNDKKRSSISNPYMTFYGSQSQGWMYGEGYAGIGGRSWMDATMPSASDKKKDKQNDSIAKANPIDNATTSKSSNSSFLLEDVTIIENALRSNGLTRSDVTPKAYACFLEQARRYSLELLADAQDYAIHANRNTIPALLPADLLLAVEMREDGGVQGVPSTLPAPEAVADLASEVNRAPLPPIPGNCYNGVALPPAEQQLTARTFDVVNGARVAQRMMRGGDYLMTAESGMLKKRTVGEGGGSKGGEGSRGISGSTNHSPSTKKKRVGSYGAGKGRQISVHIKKTSLK